jgi:hypothetical protein
VQKFFHCKQWVDAFDSHGLNPDPFEDTLGFVRVIAVEYLCKGVSCCKENKDGVFFYRWYGVKKGGIDADLHKIHQDDWKLIWLPRIEKLKGESEEEMNDTTYKAFVGVHTMLSNAAADIAGAYLKWKKSFCEEDRPIGLASVERIYREREAS